MIKYTFFLLGALAGLAQGAEVYVDAAAAVAGDGSAAKPWRSPAEAVEGLRARPRAAGEARAVNVRPGTYVFARTLTLTAKDGGAETAPVVWRRDPSSPGTVRFQYGATVESSRFRKVDDSAVLARLPESARGKVCVADVADLLPAVVPEMSAAFGGTPSAPLLFVNHALATLARWPNEGFTSFTQGVDKGDDRRPGAFVYDNPRAKRWNFAAGVWLNGYWTHDWDNRSVKAKSYGTENGVANVIRLASPIPYGVMGGTWGAKARRFYAFNLLEELDAPGEWWLDRNAKRLYLYPPAEKLSAVDEVVLACGQGPMLRLDHVDNLRFEDIAFEYAYDGGLAADGNRLAFERCTFGNVGGTGLSLNGNHNLVRACEIFNTGRNALGVHGGDRKTLTPAGTLVENCHIHHFGLFQRTYAPGAGVNGCGITLRGNKLHDAPHSAVLYGGNEHLFESNEVYAVLLETGDAGAYYTGRDWTTMGNVLRGNYTHDLGGGTLDGANTMGFYFDDCDCGDAVYDNVFHNVARGIMIGGGREHPVRGNIFSNCRIGLSIDCRGMTWKHWNSREHGGDSWLLEDKAKALNYTEGVWAEKYPLLAKIMQDHPREPLYNPVENNTFIDCTQEILALDGTASECLERMAPIRNNTVIYSTGTNGVKTAKIDARIKDGFRVIVGTPEKPLGVGPLPNGFLVADGARMAKVGPDGKKTPFVLKGTNAGSWLLTEDWMTVTSLTPNLKGENGQYELYDKFVAKFGEAKTKELFKLYRDQWWQETDFDNVKALGLNCLRLPFGWRDFCDAAGKPNPEGFARMDWFVENCRKRGLYVILDMHGAPGSQNGRHHSGDTRNPRLFTDEASMKLCIQIWQSIARRYRGNPTIAAYDLLNEPEGRPGGHTTDTAVIEGLDRLYKAVRAVDPDHLVMIESCWDTPQLPPPSKYGWTNVCYQYHFYCWDGVNKSERQAQFIASKVKNEAQTKHGVPVFVGEFTFFDDPKSWRLALSTFNEQGWGWTTWSYKIHHAKSSWGIYNSAAWRSKDNVATPDDDYETVKAKWSKLDTKTHFHENKGLADIIRAYAR